MCAVSKLPELRKVDNGKLVVSVTFPVFLAQHVGKKGGKLLLVLHQLVCVVKGVITVEKKAASLVCIGGMTPQLPTGNVVDSEIGFSIIALVPEATI